ncbi:single-stranded DNA-binding protein [Photobacterium leiognathi]|uniref:single-stranded DNA-binding protein n=1 Tax=Photobacterium leiognathi TaxID=553611 RepID=UPI002982B781|nr:single-stranded DNA-binding protein [Photobacterium leiognathi]
MFQQTIIFGNIGKEILLKPLPSGSNVVEFSVAVTEKYRDKTTSELKDITEWFNCKAFGKQAENIHKFFKSGQPIFITAKKKTERWETSEGEKRNRSVFLVREWSFSLGGRMNNATIPDGQMIDNSELDQAGFGYDDAPV